MRHSRLLLIALLIASLWPRPAQALALPAHVVISELQTGTSTSAAQEFIELYNPTDQAVALDGWQLEYRPASTSSSWINRTAAGLNGQIAAHGFYLLAPKTYLAQADNELTTGMAAGGGSIRLVDGSGNQVDLLGWGTAQEFEGQAAQPPSADGSLERLPGATNQTGGNWLDNDNNAGDFSLRVSAEPQSSSSANEDPGEVGSPVQTQPNPTTTPDPSTSQTEPAVKISELLVDPVSPQTDSKDEFIELFNPGSSPVILTGYTLKTGSNFHDKYSLPNLTIAAGSYQAFYSAETKLSLTNSGGAAELVDPSGQVVDVTASYDGSMPGLSFSRFGDDWQWTKAVTPGRANVMVAPDYPARASDQAAAKDSTKSKTAKLSSSKAASSKSSKVKAAAKAVKAKASNLLADTQKAGLNGKWLLIGLAALTLGYAIYEFRYDLQNYYVRAKRKYQAWRQTRGAS